jgi:hypothetical protein
VRSQGQAPKGRHRANRLCRPFGAVNDHAACPTVSTVGYVVTSLRDFEQHNRRTPDINTGRKFLRGRLLERFDELGGKYARFLRKILGADPVVGANCLVGLAEEAVDFLDEVFLGAIQLLAVRKLHVLFRDCDVRSRIVLRRFEVLGRELR